MHMDDLYFFPLEDFSGFGELKSEAGENDVGLGVGVHEVVHFESLLVLLGSQKFIVIVMMGDDYDMVTSSVENCGKIVDMDLDAAD